MPLAARCAINRQGGRLRRAGTQKSEALVLLLFCCLLRIRTACRSRRGERAGAYSPPRAGTLTARAWCKRAAGLLRMAVPHSAEPCRRNLWALTDVPRRPGGACCLCQGLGLRRDEFQLMAIRLLQRAQYKTLECVEKSAFFRRECVEKSAFFRREFSLRETALRVSSTCA